MRLEENPWLEACTAYQNETKITEEMVHADKSISVSFRWQDEFQKLVETLETEGSVQHEKL